eukprot:Pgem_evm1s16454
MKIEKRSKAASNKNNSNSNSNNYNNSNNIDNKSNNKKNSNLISENMKQIFYCLLITIGLYFASGMNVNVTGKSWQLEKRKEVSIPQKVILGYPNWAQCGD